MNRTTRLGNLTTRTFLNRHWQKSPRLIRKAFPEFISPVSADELAGLACEPGVESRLVVKTRQQPGWLVRQGPFTVKEFRTLPDKNWTLLVHDTDKHLPELADFLAHFQFIPNWRIDDLMISYATDGGSVGPHVDAYDVFLLQAQGRRRWSISRKPHAPAIRPGLELKQIRAFKPQHTWVLEPGDMLYLPPGVAHHGIAVGDCMTFSIGFRAPTDAEMLADLSNLLLMRLDKEARYTDASLAPANADPGLITKQARAAIRQRMRGAQYLSSGELDEWFGRFITEPKSWLVPNPPRRSLTPAALRKQFATRKKLAHDPAVRMAWYDDGTRQIKMFVNGRCHLLPARLSGFARMLCSQRLYSSHQLGSWMRDRAAIRLLTELYNAGMLYFP